MKIDERFFLFIDCNRFRMLCRQVIPDTNGIEQIYIVKSENVPELRDTTDALGPPTMDPEEVEQIKQEPSSDDEQVDDKIDTGDNFGMLDVIIKEEPDEFRGKKEYTCERNSNLKNSNAKDSLKAEYDSCSSDDDEDEEGDETSSSSTSEEENHVKWRARPSKNKHISDDSEEPSDEPEALKLVRKRGPYRKKAKSKDDSTAIKRKIIKRFICHHCPKKFSTLFNLERHEKSHESELPEDQLPQKKRNLCYVCQKEHETKEELHEHLCIHADMLPYTCGECEKPVRVISVRLLNKHYQLHQEMETGIIKCMYCPARFHSLSGCRQHERGHIEGQHIKEAEARAEFESKKLNVKVIIVDGLKRYECDYCKKSYSLLATLRRHTNSHTMEKIYVCKTCGKTFNKASSLTLHEKVHSDFKPYKCETCGKGFKETIRLIEHRRIHTGEKPFQCHCGMAFRKKHILKEHKQACEIPEDLKASNCRFCHESFPCYSDMINHVKQIHGLGMSDTKCQYCMSKFKNAVLLVIHEQRHQLPNVIKCDQCNRIFKQQSNLLRHLEIHANEPESYMCDVCGKVFTQNVNLRIHKRIHSEKRPHVCDLCNKPFYCPGTMRRHRLTHFKGNSRNYIPTLDEDRTKVVSDRIASAEMEPSAGIFTGESTNDKTTTSMHQSSCDGDASLSLHIRSICCIGNWCYL
ncbi:zinc finger protein 492-like isoform X2 [Toxorhynchites rutilus septentrionalis]|uniref:zinc finger protein 492-like isoform X2 n=1 Tax=Toxorhynchites rutilus septentrionalis TaxID=329112 RepID=UPI00247AE858|nr:zinc finger protein 492-like isoform X2 [Toxorhynchites rutilus septentrionalis]